MTPHRTIFTIGIIEILIGGLTFIITVATLFLDVNLKKPNVLAFVLSTSLASTLIGIGLLKENKLAYQLLLYFSSVIVFSKILIFFDIIYLNGAFETHIPGSFKNIVSVIYHAAVIYFLTHHTVREVFDKKQ